ncbi:MAG TPA: alpha/beta hydrolase [Streptosporangiaceae bacterium]|nr:alpha/beta hydrolase [Streptosporangiaceae bacterium]
MINRRKVLGLGAGSAALAAMGSMAPPALAATGDVQSQPPSDAELARSLPGDFRSETAQAGSVRLHYVAGGQGDPLFLLHGWPQTWWAYSKVMPGLAEHYRVIAVDLPGIGGSDKPESGYDKKTMALDIYELARTLGYEQINIAGHDIGAQVAFSFAVNHPAATKKVSLLSVTHPDESYYSMPLLPKPGTGEINLWWHAFLQVQTLPQELIAGRASFLTNWIFDDFLVNHAALTPLDRAVFAWNYNYPDAIRGSDGWYQAWDQDIADMNTYGKVTAPLLGMGTVGFFQAMEAVLPSEATNVQLQEVSDAGHYFIDEQPDVVIEAFIKFFG